jgi:hypothetical protein
MRITKMKMVFFLTFTAVLFGATGAYAGANIEKISAYLNRDIGFMVNDKTWQPKDPDGKNLFPIVYNGSSYLPTRAIAEAIGAKIDWNGDTHTISITSATYESNAGIPYKDAADYAPVSSDTYNETLASAKDKILQLAEEAAREVYEVDYKNYDGLPDHPQLYSKDFYHDLASTSQSEVNDATLHSEESTLSDFKVVDVQIYSERKMSTVIFTAIKTEIIDGKTITATHTYYEEMVSQNGYIVVNSMSEK